MDRSLFGEFSNLVDEIINEDEFKVSAKTPWRRKVDRLEQRFFGQRVFNPRLNLVSQKKNVDFVYPYLDLSREKPPFDWASWIPDFQHKRLPEYFSEKERRERDDRNTTFFKFSPKVFLSSQSALNDLKKFYPQLDASKVRILHFHTVLPESWYDENPPLIVEKYHLPKKFILISNQFWQHKNHITVFKALNLVREARPDIIFVCTGALQDFRRQEYIDEILGFVHTHGLRDRIIMLGLIPRRDQIQLMRAAAAVIQPSLFEGWSTVVEDGRALGKKMILSDIDVHLEQAPRDCTYFSSQSPEALAQILREVDLNAVSMGEVEQRARQESISLAKNVGIGFLRDATKDNEFISNKTGHEAFKKLLHCSTTRV